MGQGPLRINGKHRPALRWRVVAGVVVLVAVVFVGFDVLAVTELRRSQIGRTDSSLLAALSLVNTPARLGRLTARAHAGNPVTGETAHVGHYYVALVPPNGPPLVIILEPDVAPKLPAELSALERGKTVEAADGHGAVRALAIHSRNGTLVASTSIADVDSTVRQLRRILTVGSLIAVFVVALGVFLVVRRGLRPLETMAAEADRVTAGDLPARVNSPRPGTEVGRLADALNGMLARIETAVRDREASEARMRTFLADASHELRTPLASLLANAQLYRQGALRSEPEVTESMRRIELEAQRMSNLVDDMLRLARMDEQPPPRTDLFDVSAVVTDCVERARAADDGRAWEVEITRGLLVHGDEELVRRAVDNLLANVRTHTPAEAVALVTAQRAGSDLVIEVSDDGGGVAGNELAHIFDRFYRSKPRRNGAGSGLGLAIVAEVAAAHGGTAQAAHNDPHGLRVTLVRPAACTGASPG